MKQIVYLTRLQAPRQWRSLGAVVLIVALTGSVVIALALGAVRTTTSFTRLQQVSNPAAAIVADYLQPVVDRPALAGAPGIAAVAGLPETTLRFVGDERAAYEIDAIDNVDFGTRLENGPVIRGRMFDPKATDEIVVDEAFVQATGLDVGDTRMVRLPAGDQAATYEDFTGKSVPLTIVGVQRGPLLMLDGNGRAGTAVASPGFYRAYERELTADGQVPLLTVVWLDDGVPLSAIDAAVTSQGDVNGVTVVDVGSQLQVVARGVRVQGVALGLMALVVGVASLGLLALVVFRLTRAGFSRSRAMTAVGFTGRERGVVEVVQVVGAGVVGAAFAVLLAWGSSGAFPLGLARTVEPDPGAVTDARALLGGVVLVVVVALVGALAAWSGSRVERQSDGAGRTRPLQFLPLPITSTLAVQGAFRPSRSSSGGAALLWTGCAVAVLGVTASLTVAAGIQQLAVEPRIYGQAADAHIDLTADNGYATPAQRAAALRTLQGDPDVLRTWSMLGGAVTFRGSQLNINGTAGGATDAPVGLIKGRLPQTEDEIALAPGALRDSGLAIGDSVEVSTLDGRRESLRLVGEALLDTGNQPTFDGGAVMTARAVDELTPPIDGTVVTTPWVAIKLKPGVDRDAWIERVGRTTGLVTDPYTVPASASNLLRIRTTPGLLASLLVLVALVATGLALAFESRGLRREHAVLRSLGLTPRQSATVLPQHAPLVAVASMLVWAPLGILLGRRVWLQLSDAAHFFYVPATPGSGTVLALLMVVAVVVLLSAGPAWSLARADVPRLLRKE